MAELKQLIAQPELAALGTHPLQFTSAAKLGIDLTDIIAKLAATDGSTVYEELDCVGLQRQPRIRDVLG